MSVTETSVAEGATKHRLGTFAGVFTPSILTILGVIMFLRAGYVVAQAGVSGALGILLVAELIVLLTALSIAAISTNTQVHGGGAYYLISRVLGPEFGGAIGITLFFAQTLSVPFYILGFAEAISQSIPFLAAHLRWVCLGAATCLFVINFVGVQWAIKAQFLILGILGVCIVTFMVGLGLSFRVEIFAANWHAGYSEGLSFWPVFAIYFPAVTGIMAGINMSGDLKDPNRSLVRGTLLAVGVGFLVYGLQIILMGGAADRELLRESPYAVLLWNAVLGAAFFVVAGMFAATISSALASFLAAPRVLQAIARDKLLSPLNPFAKGSLRGDEPRRALIITYLMTVVVLWFATESGSAAAFNQVAALVTMFFLCTYLIINAAAFVEAFGRNPSFRPRFKCFHWITALCGALASLAVMMLIDPLQAIVAVTLLGGLYAYMSRRSFEVAFGDARRGFIYTHLSRNLLRLRDMRPHAKNWRPTILVLSGNPATRLHLMLYAVWMEAGRGIVTVGYIMLGNLHERILDRQHALESLQTFIQSHSVNAFPEVVVAEDFDAGVRILLQSHSIGPIKPNIVLVGWPADAARVVPFVRHLAEIRALGKSAVSVIDRGLPNASADKRIDIWWRGQANGSLMLILAHLMTRNWEWARTRIRVMRLVPDEAAAADAKTHMQTLVDAARIDAEVATVVSDRSFPQLFRELSQDAALIFLGFQPVPESEAESFFMNQSNLLTAMPTTILVSSSGEADLLA